MNKTDQSGEEALRRIDLEFAASMLKMLGHPLRLRLVELLDLYGEKTVNELSKLSQESQSTVSLYLNRLKTMGLLGNRRSGNQTYYYVTHPQIRSLLTCIRACCQGKLEKI